MVEIEAGRRTYKVEDQVYTPPSDYEDSDLEGFYSQDELTPKKKQLIDRHAGKGLSSLPVISYTKRRKRTRQKKTSIVSPDQIFAPSQTCATSCSTFPSDITPNPSKDRFIFAGQFTRGRQARVPRNGNSSQDFHFFRFAPDRCHPATTDRHTHSDNIRPGISKLRLVVLISIAALTLICFTFISVTPNSCFKPKCSRSVTEIAGQSSKIEERACGESAPVDGFAPDFALFSQGGRIVSRYTSSGFEKHTLSFLSGWVRSFGGDTMNVSQSAVQAISPGTGRDKCWSFPGTQGQLGIYLGRRVVVSHIGIDHTSMYPTSAAPKRVEVWGLIEGLENGKKVRMYRATQGNDPIGAGPVYSGTLAHPHHFLHLGQFVYDAPAHEQQLFQISNTVIELGIDISVVVIVIKDNWGGHSTYVCRIHVYGTPILEIK